MTKAQRIVNSSMNDQRNIWMKNLKLSKNAVNGSGLVTTGQSKDWQKYKLTSDTGNATQVSLGKKVTYLS
jgi:hypothetical protein